MRWPQNRKICVTFAGRCVSELLYYMYLHPLPLAHATIILFFSFFGSIFGGGPVWRLDFFLFNSILLGAAPTTCEGEMVKRRKGAEFGEWVSGAKYQRRVIVAIAVVHNGFGHKLGSAPRRTIVLAWRRHKH